jgi:predicted ATPase
MKRAGPLPGRRVRALALTLVTTAIVLVFALAEWGTERYFSDRSRAASTAIEIAIVLIAALVFRPIHQRIEAAVESAFYRRKRQSLAALEKFRRELSSFNDIHQLLRRVIEAVEHHLEASACAIYLRRDVFRAEASSFDDAAEHVGLDDPLVIRLRSSGAPAQPAALKSCARGTHAFGMTAAGDLIGFLAVEARHGDYDAQETQILTGLAGDLAAALVSLDPLLRLQNRKMASNIRADLPHLIGREREVHEIEEALTESRLVTVVGAGGVGKTCIALQCAADAIDQYEHGVWFIDLAPITDGRLVAATMLAALDVAASGDGRDTARLLEHLRFRNALIVNDNCEQVVADVASVVAQICADCPRIAILATSREPLHLDCEQVYRLGSLDRDDAIELFTRRATAVSDRFDALGHSDVVNSICERLDGIPLAIELAAARVRALSVEEILGHLDERFRLLTGGARTALPRQQTLGALIEWSYDLLTDEEQSLFRHLSAFRGSFTLAAAAAVCTNEGNCDQFHILDVLTSLADKSLLSVAVARTTRYRLLETIREFAAQKARERHDWAASCGRHATYFAAVASQAYQDFDSHLPPDWLENLAPDIDNFRSALAWTLEGPGDRRLGAQLAADCGPIFLRLQLMGEGLRACEAARRVAPLPPETAGRLEYVASMMHNNLGQNSPALEAAQGAVAFYHETSDERGLVRALSQMAQLYARGRRYDDAKAPATQAVGRARAIGEPRLLIGVLRRCAYSLPSDDIENARTLFDEALRIARSAGEPDEEFRVLEWWSTREAVAGCFARAMSLAMEGLECGTPATHLAIEIQIAYCALASDDMNVAEPHARRALALAVTAQHPLFSALGFAYCAPFHAPRDPAEAAMLFGYATARLRELQWEPEQGDELALHNARRVIEAALGNDDFNAVASRGAGWKQDQALAILASAISTVPAGPSAAALYS